MKNIEARAGNPEGSVRNAIEAWAKAPALIENYPGGFYPNPNNPQYYYPGGRRLTINGLPVMDTCEGDWAEKTIEAAFAEDRIHFLPPRHKLKVLERGAGLNMTGNKVINSLKSRGAGEYHVIELNHEVAEQTRRWKQNQLALISRERNNYGANPDIKIFIHEGEAREITRRLIEEEGEKFNIIISDTYPLTEEEQGINDIEDIETIKKGLYKNGEGVFAFYTYFPGFEDAKNGDGYVTPKQNKTLKGLFPNRKYDLANVSPPPEYTYLFGPDGEPIRKLPVVIAINY